MCSPILAISAVLFYQSYRLESSRFEKSVLNYITKTAFVSRVLPEERNDNVGEYIGFNVDDNEKEEYYVPSLDFRIRGVSQYRNPFGISFNAHVYCNEFEKDLTWEWWRPALQSSPSKRKQAQRQRYLRKDKGRVATGGNAGDETSAATRKRLLIGVTSGYDDRARLLELAVWSARVYAASWSSTKISGGITSNVVYGYDDDNGNNNDGYYNIDDVTVVTLQGTAFSPHGCKAPSSHASIDKIRLLFKAIDSRTSAKRPQQKYDRLLILDADEIGRAHV